MFIYFWVILFLGPLNCLPCKSQSSIQLVIDRMKRLRCFSTCHLVRKAYQPIVLHFYLNDVAHLARKWAAFSYPFPDYLILYIIFYYFARNRLKFFQNYTPYLSRVQTAIPKLLFELAVGCYSAPTAICPPWRFRVHRLQWFITMFLRLLAARKYNRNWGLPRKVVKLGGWNILLAICQENDSWQSEAKPIVFPLSDKLANHHREGVRTWAGCLSVWTICKQTKGLMSPLYATCLKFEKSINHKPGTKIKFRLHH
jgi:hypothetical protein